MRALCCCMRSHPYLLFRCLFPNAVVDVSLTLLPMDCIVSLLNPKFYIGI